MIYAPDIHHRRTIRLQGYDYSRSGAYFLTLCTHSRECLFGDIVDGEMRLNRVGQVVVDAWQGLASQYPNVIIDEWVLMPNHFHGILILDSVGAQFIAPGVDATPFATQGAMNRAPTIGNLVRVFKARCTHAVNRLRGTPGTPVWQRNFYERVLRDDGELARAREYIVNNPGKWDLDRDNPANLGAIHCART